LSLEIVRKFESGDCQKDIGGGGGGGGGYMGRGESISGVQRSPGPQVCVGGWVGGWLIPASWQARHPGLL